MCFVVCKHFQFGHWSNILLFGKGVSAYSTFSLSFNKFCRLNMTLYNDDDDDDDNNNACNIAYKLLKTRFILCFLFSTI